MNKEIIIDPTDYRGLVKLMDRANEFETMLVGKTEDGETQFVSINKDNITTETVQSNGWTRENVYWRDGTSEELYHR